MARFTLHGFFLSGPTYKVGLALALAGEPFDFVSINLREGEHKTQDYLAKNRFGVIPTLEDDAAGYSLAQSAAILEYIADTLGRLGGNTPVERARIREWLYWDFDKLTPPIFRARGNVRGIRKDSEETKAMYVAEGNAALHVLDAELSGKSWLIGDRPTIADVDIYAPIHFAGEGGFDIASRPHLAAWKARVEALPGFGPPAAILPQVSTKHAA